MLPNPGAPPPWTRADRLTAGSIILVVFVLIRMTAALVDASAFEDRNFDIYMQADFPRTYQQMVDRAADGSRTGVHPLYVLAVHPLTTAWRFLFGLSPLNASRVTLGLMAGLWAALLFLVARRLRLGVPDALLTTALGLIGASAVFWLPLPETFVPGGAALLFTVLIALRAQRQTVGDDWYVAGGAATLGTTLTNWSSGILLALTAGSWRKMIRLSLQAIGVVALLWIGQRLVYPNVQFIVDRHGVRQHIHVPTWSRIADVTRVFAVQAAVAPRPEACNNVPGAEPPWLLSMQGSRLWSGGVWGVTATLAWLALLGIGAGVLVRSKQRALQLVLGGSLLSQYGLHLLYGGETFLYSMHWWGLLVVVVALGLQAGPRGMVRALAIVYLVAGGVTNIAVWRSTLPVFSQGAAQYPRSGRVCDY